MYVSVYAKSLFMQISLRKILLYKTKFYATNFEVEKKTLKRTLGYNEGFP